VQPLVRFHPRSGRTSLYLPSHGRDVLGMSDAEGRALLEEHLLLALRCDDQAELRRVIPGYVAWLAAGGAGSPDNVILDGASYRLFGEPQELDVVEDI